MRRAGSPAIGGEDPRAAGFMVEEMQTRYMIEPLMAEPSGGSHYACACQNLSSVREVPAVLHQRILRARDILGIRPGRTGRDWPETG